MSCFRWIAFLQLAIITAQVCDLVLQSFGRCRDQHLASFQHTQDCGHHSDFTARAQRHLGSLTDYENFGLSVSYTKICCNASEGGQESAWEKNFSKRGEMSHTGYADDKSTGQGKAGSGVNNMSGTPWPSTSRGAGSARSSTGSAGETQGTCEAMTMQTRSEKLNNIHTEPDGPKENGVKLDGENEQNQLAVRKVDHRAQTPQRDESHDEGNTKAGHGQEGNMQIFGLAR